MKIVIQRCTAAHVEVGGETVGEIGPGLALFVGIEEGDDESELAQMARKIVALRIFDNDEGRFDRSLLDIDGAVLAISNFTLCGQTSKGARPNFSSAAKPAFAQSAFDRFVTLLRDANVEVETGSFGAHMKVCVENDGPVTLILETAKRVQKAT